MRSTPEPAPQSASRRRDANRKGRSTRQLAVLPWNAVDCRCLKGGVQSPPVTHRPLSRFPRARRAPPRGTGWTPGRRLRATSRGTSQRCKGGSDGKACPCTDICTTSWDLSTPSAATSMRGPWAGTALRPLTVTALRNRRPKERRRNRRDTAPIAPPALARRTAGRVDPRPSECYCWLPRFATWQLRRDRSSTLLTAARFQQLTDFAGNEHAAAVSRDGRFVAFLSDRDGPMDVWVTQAGTGKFYNLTQGAEKDIANSSLRTLGFSPDGSLVTFWRRVVDSTGTHISIWAAPVLGGPPRPYLDGVAEFDWTADGARLVYHTPGPGDPMFVRDGRRRRRGRSLRRHPAVTATFRSGHRISHSSISSSWWKGRSPSAWTSGASGRPGVSPSGSLITIRGSRTLSSWARRRSPTWRATRMVPDRGSTHST